MKKLNVYMFIDALGWEIVNKFNFLSENLPERRKVKMQFGYSSTALPTILSGKSPKEHGHFSFFYYDPKNSPFKFFKYMKYLLGAGLHPKCLTNRGRVRRHISKLVAKMMGYTGYFQLYSVPYEKLPYFDYCEKSDIFARDGLAPVKNLRDILEESKTPYHMSDWRKTENENIHDAKAAIASGDIDFAFIYVADFDSFLHDNVFDEQVIKNNLERYAVKVREIIKALKASGRQYKFTIISDHGMTPTNATLDLTKIVNELGFKFGKDFISIYDSTMLRLWYLNDGAKTAIRQRLSKPDCLGHFVSEEEKVTYGIDFANNKFGEDIFIMNAGVQIEPCDMGRIALKGMHGFSPEDKDSFACLLSTEPPSQEPFEVKDFFSLMQKDIQNP